MYTIKEILAAAKMASTPFTKGGVTVQITPGYQLVDTYANLSKFRAANYEDYKGWEAHHVFEKLDIDRLDLTLFAPSDNEQLCVLLPRHAHQRITSILRHRNDINLGVAIPHLRSDYREAYNEVDDYCGGLKPVIDKELYDLFDAVLVNMVMLRDKSFEIAQSELLLLLSLLSLEKGLHDKLVRGSSPSVAQVVATIAAVSNPITLGVAFVVPANRAMVGAFVNFFNPSQRPDLSIWQKAEAHAAAATRALQRRDLSATVASTALCRAQYEKADRVFRNWQKGIDVAGRKAQLAIGVAAASAAIVATGMYLVEAAGATTVAVNTVPSATNAVTSGAGTSRLRIAEEVLEIQRGVRVVFEASDAAVELEGEHEIVEGAKGMLRRMVR